MLLQKVNVQKEPCRHALFTQLAKMALPERCGFCIITGKVAPS